ncbi:methyltransferase domain-containing protein [Lentzea sp. NPDC054927]
MTTNRFQDLDRSAGRHGVATYLDDVSALHARQADVLAAAAQADPGLDVLDVGCGVGTRLLGMARAGHTGRLVGLDRSDTVLDEACRRADDEGLAVEFRHGDATTMEAEAEFDVVHSERVLIHVEDVLPVLASYARAVRPGGRVIAAEPHATAFGLNSPHIGLTNRVFSQAHNTLRQPWIATRLPSLLRGLGFADVVSSGWVGITEELARFDSMLQMTRWSGEAVTAGLITPAEEALWWDDLRTADARGEFFGSWTMFTAVGVRARF